MTGLPIGFVGISVWFAFCCLILLVTSEVFSFFGINEGLMIDKFKIRLLSVMAGLTFLILLVLRASKIIG